MPRLTSESWTGNDPVTSSGFSNAFTDRAGGNESAQSTPVSAPPLALVSIPSYVGVYTYDAAGNRTSKVTSEGARSCAYDDLNRLTEESGGGTLILEPASAGATSTESGFDVARAIDGFTTDGQGSGVAWRSSEAATTHEFTATFEAPTPVNRVDVFIPSGLGDLGKFKVQWYDGSSYVDLPAVVALGAEPHPTDAGWWRSTARQIAFLCPQIVTNHVKFVQAPGGGPLSTPNVAWLNELRATGGNLGAAIAYTYDGNGNQKTRIDGTTRETFGYDHRNRLVSYVKDDTQTQAVSSHVTYAFSPTGQRYEKHTLARSGSATDEKELFMCDGEDVATDYTQTGSDPIALAVSYVQALSIDSKIARITAGTSVVHYYVPDALGSVTKIIDAAQATVNSYYTTAWGEPLPGAPSGGPLADRYGFAQRENDAESGLYYNRARTLDTRIGRFVQRDPDRRLQRVSQYIYADSQPTGKKDPSGEAASPSEIKILYEGNSFIGEPLGLIQDVRMPNGFKTSGFSFEVQVSIASGGDIKDLVVSQSVKGYRYSDDPNGARTYGAGQNDPCTVGYYEGYRKRYHGMSRVPGEDFASPEHGYSEEDKLEGGDMKTIDVGSGKWVQLDKKLWKASSNMVQWVDWPGFGSGGDFVSAYSYGEFDYKFRVEAYDKTNPTDRMETEFEIFMAFATDGGNPIKFGDATVLPGGELFYKGAGKAWAYTDIANASKVKAVATVPAPGK